MSMHSRDIGALLIATALMGFGSGARAETGNLVSAIAAIRQAPTTRILAIGHLTAASPSNIAPQVMLQEVRSTLDLYLKGQISDWYVRKDEPGVVFILDMTNLRAARARLAELPLSKTGQLSFDLIPLGPLAPLAILAQ